MIFTLFATCTSEEVIETIPPEVQEPTSTSSSSTTSSTTTLPEETVFATDEYGIELIEMKPKMKERHVPRALNEAACCAGRDAL